MEGLTTVYDKIGDRLDILNFLSSNKPLKRLFNIANNLSSKRIELYRKGYFGIGETNYYKVTLPNSNRLFIKMEYANAMGNTHYARYWIIYLFIAEVLGVINPARSKILEVTSGSSGIALSMAAELLNYDVTILVPSLLPEKRIAPMRRQTTTIKKVDGYIGDCINKLRKMVVRRGYFATNHSEEKADIITHTFSRIGYEVVCDNIEPDFACLAIGNGTSTLSIANVLKEEYQNINIISYRPHFEEEPDDIVFGLIGADFECRHVPPAEDISDEIKFTTNVKLANLQKKYLFDTEINNLGYSSLYGIHYALDLAKKVEGKNIVCIGYDKKDRY